MIINNAIVGGKRNIRLGPSLEKVENNYIILRNYKNKQINAWKKNIFKSIDLHASVDYNGYIL